jgi:hypothetical protein
MQFRASRATSCKALINCINVSYVVGHERANSLLFQRIVSILYVLIIFSCGYLKCCVIYIGEDL